MAEVQLLSSFVLELQVEGPTSGALNEPVNKPGKRNPPQNPQPCHLPFVPFPLSNSHAWEHLASFICPHITFQLLRTPGKKPLGAFSVKNI